MLEKIYAMIGYEDIFEIKNNEVRAFATIKAHEKLMDLLTMCKDLDIVPSINESMLDEIESEEF